MDDNGRGYAYAIGPIDHWIGWSTLRGAALAQVDDAQTEDHGYAYSQEWLIDHMGNQLEAAKKMFLELGWEGDIREGPYVTAIPLTDECNFGLLFALKQDNNGQTFIWSPVPLPYLKNAWYTRSVMG